MCPAPDLVTSLISPEIQTSERTGSSAKRSLRYWTSSRTRKKWAPSGPIAGSCTVVPSWTNHGQRLSELHRRMVRYKDFHEDAGQGRLNRVADAHGLDFA